MQLRVLKDHQERNCVKAVKMADKVGEKNTIIKKHAGNKANCTHCSLEEANANNTGSGRTCYPRK